MQWSFAAVFVAGALFVPGCAKKAAPPQTSKASSPQKAVAMATPLNKADTVVKVDTTKFDVVPWTDTTKKGDTTFYTQGTASNRSINELRTINTTTVQVTKHWWTVATAPAVIPGITFGAAALPADSICSKYLGMRNTVAAYDTLATVPLLAKLKSCGGKLVLRPPRNMLKGPPLPTNAAGCLNADSASARIKRWKWAALRPYVTDGTIMDIELVDDPAASKEWCFDLKTVFTMVEKVACTVKDSAPGVALGARALPTQMAVYSPYNCLTTARAQYAGPGKHFHPDTFVVQQARSAERQKLGVIWGMNLVAMGCGPPTNRQPGAYPYRCIPGHPGTNLWEHGFYAPNADEVGFYGMSLAKASRSCGFVSWSFEYAPEFFKRQDNLTKMKMLADTTAARLPSSCIQR